MRSIKINTHGLFTAILMSLLLLSACSNDTVPESQDTAEVRAQVAQAQKHQIVSYKTFNGTLKSEVRSEIGTKVLGEIESVPVDIGDKVSKGTLILKIKDDDLEAKKAQAQAGLEEAESRLESVKKDYERFKVLFEQGSATPKEWDDIQTQYQTIRARVQAAKGQLKEINDLLTYTQIKAPYDGMIAAKYAAEGDIASPGRALLAVEQTGSFKIEASIPESEISSIKEGDTAKVHIPAWSDAHQKAVVTEVSASGNPQSRQFQVEFRLLQKNNNEGLRSGMFAEILIEDRLTEQIAVSNEALLKRGQLIGIYTLNNEDRAMLRWIRTGRKTDGRVEVISGLKLGERYVTQSDVVIREGIKVISE